MRYELYDVFLSISIYFMYKLIVYICRYFSTNFIINAGYIFRTFKIPKFDESIQSK